MGASARVGAILPFHPVAHTAWDRLVAFPRGCHNGSEHYCVKRDAPNLLIGFRIPVVFTFTFKSDRAITLSERMRAWKKTHSSARPQRLPPLKLMPEARITVPEICGYTLLGLGS